MAVSTSFSISPRMLVSMLVILLFNGIKAEVPIAMHQLIVVPQASNAVIRLKGFDSTNKPALTYTVNKPTLTGNLYQLSQVYSNYNIEPKMGTPFSSTMNVTGSNNRVYYTRPNPDMITNKLWDTFTFTVTNKLTRAKSYPGTVTMVAPNGYLVSSNFLLNNEGWNIVGNKASSMAATYEPFSRGQQLNHYIMGTDDVVNVLYQNGNNRGLTKPASQLMAAEKSDASLWYFHAPSKYYGNFGISYTGTLSFTMASFSGDFTVLNRGDTQVVQMECTQCIGPVTKGIKLVYTMSTLLAKQKLNTGSSSTTMFSIPLTETSGWQIDPQNTLITTWRQPTKCEFIQVLSAITSLNVLGDWTVGVESVGLDNVSIAANTNQASKGEQSGNVVPLCALHRPDASVCTC